MAIMEAIETIYVEEEYVSSVEFTSIPSTYEHLELSLSCKSSYGAAGPGTADYEAFWMRFGTGGGAVDSAGNYHNPQMWWNGTSEGGGNSINNTGIYCNMASENTWFSEVYRSSQVQIFDYANTNKNTATWEWLGGYPASGVYQEVAGGIWANTGAVDRIQVIPYTGSQAIVRGTTVSLYGIKSS